MWTEEPQQLELGSARLGSAWNGMSGMLTGAFRRLFPTLRVTLKLKGSLRFVELTTVTFTPRAHARES